MVHVLNNLSDLPSQLNHITNCKLMNSFWETETSYGSQLVIPCIWFSEHLALTEHVLPCQDFSFSFQHINPILLEATVIFLNIGTYSQHFWSFGHDSVFEFMWNEIHVMPFLWNQTKHGQGFSVLGVFVPYSWYVAAFTP